VKGGAEELGRRAALARVSLFGVVALDVAMEGVAFSGDRGFAFVSTYGDLVYLAASVVTAVFFLRWFHLAVQSVSDRGVDLGVSPFRAVTFWFIPIVNFIRPYSILRQSLAALKAPSGSVTLWQVAWIVGGVVSAAAAPRSLVELAATGLDIAAAVLAARVIALLTSAMRV
jgi:hypothetical protein